MEDMMGIDVLILAVIVYECVAVTLAFSEMVSFYIGQYYDND